MYKYELKHLLTRFVSILEYLQHSFILINTFINSTAFIECKKKFEVLFFIDLELDYMTLILNK